MVCEAERRGYKKVRIVADADGWPVGSIVWLNEKSRDEDECWNDNCTRFWFHSIGISAEYVNEGPVRTVTRKEIVPGSYGKVRVTAGMYVHVNSMSTATDIRAAIATLTEIAEALETK